MPLVYSLLKKSDIKANYGIPISTLDRWIKSGQWIKPMKIGGTPFWRKSDIEQFLQNLADTAKGGAC